MVARVLLPEKRQKTSLGARQLRIAMLAAGALACSFAASTRAAEPQSALLPALLGSDGVVTHLLGAGGSTAPTLTNLALLDPAMLSGSENTGLIPPSSNRGGGSLLASILGAIPIIGTLLFPPPPPTVAPTVPAAPPTAIGDLDDDGRPENASPRFGRYLTRIDPETAFAPETVSLETYDEAPTTLPTLSQ